MMKHPDQSPEEFPLRARQALRKYPQIKASSAFNSRVMDAVTNQRSLSPIDAAIASLCDRLDDIFANPLLRIAGAALLGMAISWGCCQLIFHLPFEILDQGKWLFLLAGK